MHGPHLAVDTRARPSHAGCMARARPLYAGPTGRLAADELGALDSRWVVQEKHDGTYVHASFDRTGRLSALVTRAGQLLPLGAYAGTRGPAGSVLACEAELWTQASQRAVRARGWPVLHAFDCIRATGRDVSRERYEARRDALWRAFAATERPVRLDACGDYHGRGGLYAQHPPELAIVEQHPVSKAPALWERAVGGEIEGLVVVAREGTLGGRRAKLKCKPASEIDVVVTQVDARALVTWWQAAQKRVVVARPRSMDVSVGAVVEVRHEGFTDDGVPKFARVVRPRPDLSL